jgi:hypothetical protein
MNKYDAMNKERRHIRNEKHFLRGNKELTEMLNIASKDITISIIQNIPDDKRIEYAVLFKLKTPLTPIEFQTLLSNKLKDLI